jgi:hypothetical protein
MIVEAVVMVIRQVIVIERETRIEAHRPVTPSARQVAACAVLNNPYAGQSAAESASDAVALEYLAAWSAEIGVELTQRALARFAPDETPIAYSKGVIVGTNGDREHGAAMIHMRIGLAMRQGLGAGSALIPGTKKCGPPGTAIDLIFGGAADGWNYDAMDAMEVAVPGAPLPDEILLIVAFATGRPNARVAGATPAQVAALMRDLGTR